MTVPIQPVLPDIRSLTEADLEARLRQLDEKPYRSKQILDWLYKQRVATWDAMTNLPKELRGKLSSVLALRPLELVRRQGSRDTTQKFLWKLTDGAMIESVLIPANPSLYGEASDRHTLCISTQVGCAYGCRFCASGLDGWKRNLKPEEILDQVLAVERWNDSQPDAPETPAERLINNLVIMGMGEPLANYDNLMHALRTLNAPWGVGIGARKITISTSGVVPRIKQLADEPEQFRLAISLHGATDEVRDKIMPVNRKYPLKELGAACDYYVEKKGRMITLEYILLDGINDDPSIHAEPLIELARRLQAKVNLIPYNKVDGLPWERPQEARCIRFADTLREKDVITTLRLEKGHDIDAACGQLRLKTEKELAAAQPAD